jgi:hypothetical protein
VANPKLAWLSACRINHASNPPPFPRRAIIGVSGAGPLHQA